MQRNAFPGGSDLAAIDRSLKAVLTRERSIRNNWMQHIFLEEANRLEPGMERIVGSISRRTWADLREFLDCDGQIGD